MNRGDLREPIFKDDADRFRCLETLGGVLRQDQLASACLLLDVQPFSFGARNSKGQPGGGHEMVLKQVNPSHCRIGDHFFRNGSAYNNGPLRSSLTLAAHWRVDQWVHS